MARYCLDYEVMLVLGFLACGAYRVSGASGSSQGAIGRPWHSNKNIAVCDYASAFPTQGTTLRITEVCVVEHPTRKLEHVDLERLVRALVRRSRRADRTFNDAPVARHDARHFGLVGLEFRLVTFVDPEPDKDVERRGR